VNEDIFTPMSSSNGLHDKSSNKTFLCIFISFLSSSSSCLLWLGELKAGFETLSLFEDCDLEGVHQSLKGSRKQDKELGCACIVEGVEVLHGYVEEVVQGQGDV